MFGGEAGDVEVGGITLQFKRGQVAAENNSNAQRVVARNATPNQYYSFILGLQPHSL